MCPPSYDQVPKFLCIEFDKEFPVVLCPLNGIWDIWDMGSFNLKWFQLLFCIASKTFGTARLASSSAGGPGQGLSHGQGHGGLGQGHVDDGPGQGHIHGLVMVKWSW